MEKWCASVWIRTVEARLRNGFSDVSFPRIRTEKSRSGQSFQFSQVFNPGGSRSKPFATNCGKCAPYLHNPMTTKHSSFWNQSLNSQGTSWRTSAARGSLWHQQWSLKKLGEMLGASKAFRTMLGARPLARNGNVGKACTFTQTLRANNQRQVHPNLESLRKLQEQASICSELPNAALLCLSPNAPPMMRLLGHCIAIQSLDLWICQTSYRKPETSALVQTTLELCLPYFASVQLLQARSWAKTARQEPKKRKVVSSANLDPVLTQPCPSNLAW